MAASTDNRTFSQRYLKVRCRCGRMLRVGVEHMGSTVRCWDCRRVVPVSVPRPAGQAARVLTVSARDVFGARGLLGIGLGAVVFTTALLLPVPEPVIAALVAAALAFAYGELVRNWGQAGALGEGTGSLDWRTYAARAAATLAFALVLTNAWEFGRTWLGFEPGLFREALAVLTALAVVFPLAMLTIWAAPRPRQSLAAIGRRPFLTLMALMVVPLGLVAAEALVLAVTIVQGWFSFYVLDLMPGAVELAPRFGIPPAGLYAFNGLPDHGHLGLYVHHLRHGLALSMGLPASLLDPPHLVRLPWSIELSERAYLAVRAAHTCLVAAVWLSALAIQARCLGLLARLSEWQRPHAGPILAPTEHDGPAAEAPEAEAAVAAE